MGAELTLLLDDLNSLIMYPKDIYYAKNTELDQIQKAKAVSVFSFIPLLKLSVAAVSERIMVDSMVPASYSSGLLHSEDSNPTLSRQSRTQASPIRLPFAA